MGNAVEVFISGATVLESMSAMGAWNFTCVERWLLSQESPLVAPHVLHTQRGLLAPRGDSGALGES